MDYLLIIEWVIKAVVILLFCVTGFAYLTFYERRALARMQIRIGPNRAGPSGWLQPVADGIKLIFKEEVIPARAYKVLFILAPMITVFPALVILAVIPWGTAITIFGRTIPLYLTDINVGALYLVAIASISVYGIVLAGWSSNNKYAMMGGIRSSAQMISYELAMGLSLIGPIMIAGTMSLMGIVEAQDPIWFIIYQPVAAIVFFIASVAEYSGMKFALFFMAEYVKMIAISAIGATLFLGGFSGPFIDQVPILGPFYLFFKILVLLFLLIWMRATLPRLRYDRLMAFGWKILLPVALANVFLTAVVLVLIGG